MCTSLVVLSPFTQLPRLACWSCFFCGSESCLPDSASTLYSTKPSCTIIMVGDSASRAWLLPHSSSMLSDRVVCWVSLLKATHPCSICVMDLSYSDVSEWLPDIMTQTIFPSSGSQLRDFRRHLGYSLPWVAFVSSWSTFILVMEWVCLWKLLLYCILCVSGECFISRIFSDNILK